jgi:hypothetical protein
MDWVTLIVTALAAGAALGLKDTASTAAKDAYRFGICDRNRLFGIGYDDNRARDPASK